MSSSHESLPQGKPEHLKPVAEGDLSTALVAGVGLVTCIAPIFATGAVFDMARMYQNTVAEGNPLRASVDASWLAFHGTVTYLSVKYGARWIRRN
jgi:hypothetical protein